MSASSKKKLRNEQNAAMLTERQQAEQKEAKKLKTMTAAFVAGMALILVIAVFVGATQFITNNGIREKNTVALTVNGNEISNAELNYFYIDAINEFYNNYGSYISLFGLDVTKPLNEQVVDEETGLTWADDFINSAKESAKATYALADAAKAAGYTLSEAEQKQVTSALSNIKGYALIYGYGDLDTYLKAMYGLGASEESYRAYYETNLLANSYYTAYSEGLTYDSAALKAGYDENPAEYAAYSYNYYYLTASSFREGGTKDDEGNVTYSEEEKASALAACEEAAKSLITEENKTVDALDAAIDALSVNENTTASTTASDDVAYSAINSVIRDWVTSGDRKAGDLEMIPSTSTSKDENGAEVVTTNGYYVVLFRGINDNSFALKNVRHILVAFEGGTTDSTTGTTTYSEAEKIAAKEKAEELLAQWKAGDATEESFAALANEKSADGDGTTGGLYENVYPGQMVENFENWTYEEGRVTGDTGIVESPYGYHVMYFVADSETNYRDFQVENHLRSHDTEDWYTALIEATEVTDGDTSYLAKNMILSNG
jgi:parvulin-like peptidyl-prolyl isomerase